MSSHFGSFSEVSAEFDPPFVLNQINEILCVIVPSENFEPRSRFEYTGSGCSPGHCAPSFSDRVRSQSVNVLVPMIFQ